MCIISRPYLRRTRPTPACSQLLPRIAAQLRSFDSIAAQTSRGSLRERNRSRQNRKRHRRKYGVQPMPFKLARIQGFRRTPREGCQDEGKMGTVASVYNHFRQERIDNVEVTARNRANDCFGRQRLLLKRTDRLSTMYALHGRSNYFWTLVA
jgi:hypothetical protein